MTKADYKSESENRAYVTKKIALVHAGFAGLLVASAALYEASNLMTPDAIRERWIFAILMAITSVVVFILARVRIETTGYYSALIWTLILLDIFIAGSFVYSQRGMASLAVALFSIPIVTAALLKNWKSILLATALSIGVYVNAAIRYFNDNPSEGYKVELYGEIAFYSIVYLLVFTLLSIVIVFNKKDSKKT
jgi:hypothetical protein